MIMPNPYVHLERIKEKEKLQYSLKILEVKTKEPKQANQENFLIMAFINAKNVEHEANLDVVGL